MKFIYDMELVLKAIISILCTILVFKLIYKLRSSLPWRVNCWFCNGYFWMKFVQRNSWNCPKCEQYNGFTKDGDYNKPIIASNDQAPKIPRFFRSSPPKNGLCQMCNINQQLKVAQLANFLPINEKNYDEEIEAYKLKLEKAYKLCNPCKNVVQMKLHKEKETLLGTKLLESRTPEKKNQKKVIQSHKLKNFINETSMLVASILLILISIECYKNIIRNKNSSSTVINIEEILSGLLDRIGSIVKMKTLITFPSLEHYLNDVHNILYLDILPKHFHFTMKSFDHVNVLTQRALGGFVSSIQIIGHIGNINKLKYAVMIDLLWVVFVISTVAHHSITIGPVGMSLIKLSSTLAVLMVYRSMKTKTVRSAPRIPLTPKKIRNLNNVSVNTSVGNDDNLMDTDDDEPLSKYGLHNSSGSSNDTIGSLNNSLINGRSFTPWTHDGIWTTPKLNSTYCVNSVLSKSPSSVSDTVFMKPSFTRYNDLLKSDSDSELDEISSLYISSPKKSNKRKRNGIFSMRHYTASPNFVAPTPLNRPRPVISPSRLGHSTSWVAGGYWGTEGERQIFSVDGSRTSSHSSGFESQTSSMNQRNLSQPPSRDESDCGEPPKLTLLDRFQNCNMSNYSTQTPQNFPPMSLPVFPQMQYNGHVHIPQARFAQQSRGGPRSQNVFTQQQQCVQNNMFKAPGGSGLINLPQVNSFASR